MTSVVKILANTITLTTSANTVFGAKCVRVRSLSPILITQFDSLSTQIGSVVLRGNTEITIQKASTDTLTSNDSANCTASAVAFSF